MEGEKRHFICPMCNQVVEMPLPEGQSPQCHNEHKLAEMADMVTLFRVTGSFAPAFAETQAYELLLFLQDEVLGEPEPENDYQI